MMTMCVSIAEVIGRGVPREEKVPDKEHEVHEAPELDRPEVVGELHVFTGPEAEVEANYDQVGDVVGSGIRGSG